MYVVLEYIRGPTLSERVTGRSAGRDTIDRFGVPVVRALEFLHRNGLCYQDCRPENIIVRAESDSPVLIDYNTAEPADSADTLFHEDGFKAPEQMPPEDTETTPGPWSDVYAAGKLLVYLLTGTTIFGADTPEQGVEIAEYGVDVPQGVDRVIQQATHTDPSERPRTAGELLNRLYRHLEEDTATAELIDARGNTQCPVRPGYTVGRVRGDDKPPDIAASDSKQYVSPNHLEVDRDEESWFLRDQSLNGTWINASEQWQRLLSESGYHRLQREAPNRAPDEQPYAAGRLIDGTDIALVDPSYDIRMTFRTCRA
jgi:serine/threonine protein kinase